MTKIEGSGAEGGFLSTGHIFHADSGLFLAQYRAYAPRYGFWLNASPYGLASSAHSESGILEPEFLPEGPNLYSYVANNPVSYWDYEGLSFFSCEANCQHAAAGKIALFTARHAWSRLRCGFNPACHSAALAEFITDTEQVQHDMLDCMEECEKAECSKSCQ